MFARAADKLGIALTLATDRCHILEDPWADRAVPIRFEDPSGSAEKIPECSGIIAVGDRPTLVAALAAERLGIPFHSFDAVSACNNKHAARERFRAAGLPAPDAFLAHDHSASAHAPYPCVLKPLGLSASRGVIRANDEAGFRAAFARIRAMLSHDQAQSIQVESFIEGREFALEGVVTEGDLTVLAIFDKPDPLDGPFFEETIYITPSREGDETQRAIEQTTRAAVKALGLSYGPIHAEMRVNNAGVFMLEVAARPIGGLCARALRFKGGTSLEELLLRHALGEDVSGLTREEAASGVMMIPIPRGGIYEDVRGEDVAREVPGIEDVIVTAKRGQKIVPLPEGASYLGFIFARGAESADVEAALRAAHAKLDFQIAQMLPVV
ncbi:MAG: ATP-dependent carboxylate-amine ligase domain protein ATP-grasp [Bryobacterales bacterium]|nr:ATP-dependent carboxylate-amine ligase domain protein ATP-grasp [Bryobacterales bacterium]